MRIIRAALRRRYARLRKNERRKRDRRRLIAARRAARRGSRPGLVAVIRASLSHARIARAIEAAFLAAVVGACGLAAPRGEVGEGGAVHGLMVACMRLGESADANPGAARTWFNSFCAPFFGWPKVEDAPSAPAPEVAHGG